MPQPCLTEKGVEIMRPLKEVLEENKQAYIPVSHTHLTLPTIA